MKTSVSAYYIVSNIAGKFWTLPFKVEINSSNGYEFSLTTTTIYVTRLSHIKAGNKAQDLDITLPFTNGPAVVPTTSEPLLFIQSLLGFPTGVNLQVKLYFQGLMSIWEIPLTLEVLKSDNPQVPAIGCGPIARLLEDFIKGCNARDEMPHQPLRSLCNVENIVTFQRGRGRKKRAEENNFFDAWMKEFGDDTHIRSASPKSLKGSQSEDDGQPSQDYTLTPTPSKLPNAVIDMRESQRGPRDEEHAMDMQEGSLDSDGELMGDSSNLENSKNADANIKIERSCSNTYRSSIYTSSKSPEPLPVPPGYTRDLSESTGFAPDLTDCLLVRPTVGKEKLEYLGQLLKTLLEEMQAGRDEYVLVLGDRPGHMSQVLAAKGIKVVGVDGGQGYSRPLWLAQKYKTFTNMVPRDLSAMREMIFNWQETGVLVGSCCLIVCDMAAGSHSQVEDTKLNYEAAGTLGCILDAPYVVKLRTMPLPAFDLLVLATAGHQARGAEVYALGGINRETIPKFIKRAVSFIMFGSGFKGRFNSTNTRVIPQSAPYREIFRNARYPLEAGVGIEGLDLYYSMIQLRNVIDAKSLGLRTFMSAAHQRTLADAFGMMQEAMYGIPPIDAETISRLEGRGRRGSDMENSLDRRTMSVSQSLIPAMQQRYDELIQLCSPAINSTQDPALGHLHRLPGFGALLHCDLRMLSNEVETELPYITYTRVLPLAAMGILATKAWFEIIRLFLRFKAMILFQPWETYRAQALLWSLSQPATQSEREQYMWHLFSRGIKRIVVGHCTEQAKGDMGRLLQTLHSLEPEWDKYVSEDVFRAFNAFKASVGVESDKKSPTATTTNCTSLNSSSLKPDPNPKSDTNAKSPKEGNSSSDTNITRIKTDVSPTGDGEISVDANIRYARYNHDEETWTNHRYTTSSTTFPSSRQSPVKLWRKTEGIYGRSVNDVKGEDRCERNSDDGVVWDVNASQQW
ncbi:MAG: hypothetical protein M1834_006836 [Cirrosporium novae-zelandiae]|nr:MAG: hypothetical protein M1834_006836 [Cirrosporium novae-zelandiae]